MKFQKWMILGVLVAAFAGVSQAEANYRPERGYRYSVRYSDWDRGFNSYYGYYERECRVSYTGHHRYSTCYEVSSADTLYIEERHMNGGYRQVRVYRYEHDTTPYTTYYIYDDGYTRRVEYREFHHHYYHGGVYYTEHYHHHSHVWVTLDWDNGFDKIIVGAYTALIGAEILAGAGDNAALAVIGLSSMAMGSLSMSLGTDQLERESELARHIAENSKNSDRATDID